MQSRRDQTWYRPDVAGDTQKCPACGTHGWITGEVTRTSAPRVGEDEILQTFTKLPTGFTCAACGLKLQREAEMHAAGLGALYDVEIGEDPASFSGIETAESVSLEDFYDAYGNE